MADRENPVIIQSGKAKDKGPHQDDYYHVDDEDVRTHQHDHRDERIQFPKDRFERRQQYEAVHPCRQYKEEVQARLHNQEGNYARREHYTEDHGGIVTRSVCIDFPRFDGTDPFAWLYKANQFFFFHRTPYPQMLILASIHMEGKTLVWYQDMAESVSFSS